ncbi:MAG: phospholipid carrier-dependent glycosyltransferase [Flavobacteriaceae bacterium]
MKLEAYLRQNPRTIRIIIILGILLLAIVRSWYGTRLDSFANDEPYHIVSGTYYAKTGDYRLNPEHPPLSKFWVGLWNQHNLELRPFKVLDDKGQERKWLQEIMFFDNDDHLSQRQSRWAMYSFHFVLGLLIALMLWNIFGFGWALVSLLWLALEPTIGAHQPLVFTDLPLTYAMILAALTAGKMCSQWSWKWVIAFGIAAGGTLAAKHSALPGLAAIGLLGILLALIPFFRRKMKLGLHRVLKLVVAAILGLTVLWATYGFQYHSSEGAQDKFNRSLELKIADLNTGMWQNLVSFMDQSHLFPRAYVWGFADTIRAGIEGRGEDEHLFFGTIVEGRAPYLYFPGAILAKLPLALIAIFLIATMLLSKQLIAYFRSWKSPVSESQWIVVAFVCAFIVAHLLALASGRTSYGGIRHALPVVGGIGTLAGGIVLLKIPRISYANRLLPAALFGVTLIMTLGEERIYEYYNEIVGGTENAYKYFADEGVYQGQRFYETKAFFDQPGIDQEENISCWAWYMREEWESEHLNFEADAVKDIYDDSNQDGLMKGYYILPMNIYLKWSNWDPNDIKDLKTVKRIGNISIAYGEFVDPKNWAYSMSGKVIKYIRETDNPDWALVANRLEGVTKHLDWSTTSFVLLGNAYLRTTQKEKALTAYKRAQANYAQDDPYQKSLKEHISALEKIDDLTKLANLRPASFE